MKDHSFVRILGVPIVRMDTESALTAVEELGESSDPALIAYANAHTLNLAWADIDYRRLLLDAGLVLNDGIGIELAARMRGVGFPANLNGSDFNPEILRLAAAKGWRAFFLGARPGVAETAAARLVERIEGLEVVGCRDGYFDENENDRVVEEIRESGAAVLMVALGNPLQERWLADNLDATGARLGVGVGAFFDFTAGSAKRAPGWMNKVGIEWVWRLALEPRRMWRRYVVGNPLFLRRAWSLRNAERVLL